MKKIFTLFLALFVMALMPGCSQETGDEHTLYIYNWEEYIDEELLDLFVEEYFLETGEEIEVVYNTFETNETMYNNFKTGKQRYDLICPSDYLIQKMMLNDELMAYDREADGSFTYLDNYNDYASLYIKDLFDSKIASIKGNDHPWSDYAIPYMWGTVGLIYNVNAFDFEEFEDDMTSWMSLWDSKYKNTFTIKNSVRDTYFVGLVKVYEEELTELAQAYENDEMSQQEYTDAVTVILNRCDNETISKVEVVLKELKNNSFGLEVDSGKNDILTGKISINIAWSGDAVYAIELADANDVELAYVIPELGSNLFFDGWVMPKGANAKLAQAFLNFLCSPESAVANMYETGYTSAIGGQEVFDAITEWYGVEDENDYDEEDPIVPFDLSYFFEGTLDDDVDAEVLVYESEIGIISAQYVDSSAIARCTIMEDFGDQNNAIVAMWNRVKVMDVPNWLYILVGAVTIAFIGGLLTLRVRKNAIRRKRKKGLKVA